MLWQVIRFKFSPTFHVLASPKCELSQHIKKSLQVLWIKMDWALDSIKLFVPQPICALISNNTKNKTHL